METMKIEAIKLYPDFYCTKKGVCDKIYTCINPSEVLNPVCPHLVVKSPGRKMYETTSFRKHKEESKA